MQRDTDIIGWFYKNGKRIPIRKGKGHAKTKSGWSKPESPYSGAGEDYQHLYKGGKKAGSVMGWSDDGDSGYNARSKDKKYLGNYNTRAKAQKAVEKAEKKSKKDPITEKNGKFYLKSPVNGTQRIFNTKEAAQNYLRNADVIDSHARGLGRSAEHAGPHTKKKR